MTTTLAIPISKRWNFPQVLWGCSLWECSVRECSILECSITAVRGWTPLHELLCAAIVPGSEVSPSGEIERKLIREIQDGNQGKYQQVVERYQQIISRRMWKFSRLAVEHEELVQEVFVEAYLSLRNFRGEAPFEHWLQRIATRVGYRFWKRRKQTRETETEELVDLAVMEEDGGELAAAEAAATVYRLLARLPTDDRLVMTLLHLEEYSVAEIAEQIGWSESNVKVRAHRARKKLAEWLREEEHD